MKKILILALIIFSGLAVLASDLIIESKTQTFSDKEKKIKLGGGVTVKIDNLTVKSPTADVSIRRNNKLDIATFYDKPYAFEINANKKREVKANILQVSLINKVVPLLFIYLNISSFPNGSSHSDAPDHADAGGASGTESPDQKPQRPIRRRPGQSEVSRDGGKNL